MKKGIIFDFNGTVLWDTDLHNHAWDCFLKSHSLILSDNDKDLLMHGKSNYEIFNYLFKKELSNTEINKLSEEKESIYRRLCLEEKLKLADGCIEFFEECNRRKVPMAIATSSLKENVEFYIKTYHLNNWFDLKNIIFSNGKIKSKPDPEMFNIAINRIDIKPKNAIIFEDSYAGIEAAENAKAGKVIIVNSNNNNYTKFNHRIINSFRELNVENILY